MIARSTAMPMVAALNTPNALIWLRVRGRLIRKHTTAVTTLQTTVHAAVPSVRVLRSFAPTRQWRAARCDLSYTQAHRTKVAYLE